MDDIDTSRLALELPDDSIHVWAHTGSTVNYGVDVEDPTDLLAPDVASLAFTGLQADGATVTTTPSQIQCLRIDVSVMLPRSTGDLPRTVSSWAWIRSW